MKKSIIVAVLCYSFISSAQIKTGRVFLGGEFGIQNIAFGPFSQYSQGIRGKFMPNVGIMVSNRVGLQFTFGVSTAPDPISSSMFPIRNYFAGIGGISLPIFFPFSDKFAFYISPSIGLAHIKSDFQLSNGNTNEHNSLNMSIV